MKVERGIKLEMNNRYIVEKDFTHKGFKCLVIFHRMGHRCGYVAVNKNHPLYGLGYDEDSVIELNVHGGFTYAENHIPCLGECDYWWFGFDCAHYGDVNDWDRAIELFPEDTESYLSNKQLDELFGKFGTVKSLEYVEAECKKLADQLSEWRREEENDYEVI